MNEPARVGCSRGPAPRIHRRELPDRSITRDRRRTVDAAGDPGRLLRRSPVQRLPRPISTFQKPFFPNGFPFWLTKASWPKTPGGRGRDEYVLTPKGRRLWPTIWSLVSWGNENYVDQSHRRSYRHADCGGAIRPDRVCARCGQLPDVADLVLHPPRRPRDRRDDTVSAALRQPHRMLEPIHPGVAATRDLSHARPRAR